jgi:hypothetical protein
MRLAALPHLMTPQQQQHLECCGSSRLQQQHEGSKGIRSRF